MARKREDNASDETIHVEKSNPAIYVVVGILIFVAIVVGALIVGNGMTGNVVNDLASSVQKNCVDVQVPYSDTEIYTDSEPYTTQDCQSVNFAKLKDCRKAPFTTGERSWQKAMGLNPKNRMFLNRHRSSKSPCLTIIPPS